MSIKKRIKKAPKCPNCDSYNTEQIPMYTSEPIFECKDCGVKYKYDK